MYSIIFSKGALGFFNKLSKFEQEKIGKKIEMLKEFPKQGKPLSGNLRGLWRLRVDKFRVIYQIKDNELIVYVLNIGHRAARHTPNY